MRVRPDQLERRGHPGQPRRWGTERASDRRVGAVVVVSVVSVVSVVVVVVVVVRGGFVISQQRRQ